MPYNNKTQYSRPFALAILLNCIFVCIELFYGFKSNSVALISDSIHKTSDVIGLAMVWFSFYISAWERNHKFTFGFKKATIIAAFINSFILLFAIGNLLWESLHRLISPEPVTASIVIWVSVLGIFINVTTAALFLKHRNDDLNVMTAYLNMLLDSLISISVVIGGIFMWWQNWVIVDPILGIIISIAILFSIWKLFKESITLIMHGVPSKVDLPALIEDIDSMTAISSYHALHVWALSTNETALSVHLTTSHENFDHNIIAQFTELLRSKYNIDHATIQLEIDGEQRDCLNC